MNRTLHVLHTCSVSFLLCTWLVHPGACHTPATGRRPGNTSVAGLHSAGGVSAGLNHSLYSPATRIDVFPVHEQISGRWRGIKHAHRQLPQNVNLLINHNNTPVIYSKTPRNPNQIPSDQKSPKLIKLRNNISSSYRENIRPKKSPNPDNNEEIKQLLRNLRSSLSQLTVEPIDGQGEWNMGVGNATHQSFIITEDPMNDLKDLNANRTEEILKASWPVKIFNCIRSRNIIQCLKIFILQRGNLALNMTVNQNITERWFEDILSLPSNNTENYTPYENLTDSQLDERIITLLFTLFDKRDLKFHFLPGVTVRLTPSADKSVNLAVRIKDLPQDDMARKIKVKMSDLYPFLLLPPLIMAGILPLLLPGIKMAVMTVAMLNQMAFMASLFALIRGMIFDPRPSDRVVYVNHGYRNEKSSSIPEFQFTNGL